MRISGFLVDSIQRLAQPRAWTQAMLTMPNLDPLVLTAPGSGAAEAMTTLGLVLSDATAASSLYATTLGVAE